MVNEKQNNWDDFLEVVSHSINHNVRSGTKYSPYYILFGFHPRKVVQMDTEHNEGSDEVDAEQLDFYINRRVAERQDLLNKV